MQTDKRNNIGSYIEKLEQKKAEHVNAAENAHQLWNVHQRLAWQERANNEAHKDSAKWIQQEIDKQYELEENARTAYDGLQDTIRNMKFLARPPVPCLRTIHSTHSAYFVFYNVRRDEQ